MTPDLKTPEQYAADWRHNSFMQVEDMFAICQQEMAEACAKIAQDHRQQIFEDGLEVDLKDMDKKSIFLESMVQERACITDKIRQFAEKLRNK